ncbi:MAG: LysR family transcriptional regulator [Phycisphaerales bacterium]
MELRSLKQMVAIAEHGHMTRAAQALGVTQPALSAAVRKLEEELGTALFHRTGVGVDLTEEGKVFLEHARDAIRASERAGDSVREMVGLETGSVRIGAGATATGYLLPRAIQMVRKSHPGLWFSIREAGSGQVVDGVLSGELDLGIVTLPIDDARREELMVIHEFEDELMLIVPAGHRLDDRRTFRWGDLEGEPVIAFEAGSAVRGILDAASSSHGVSLSVVMELRSIEAIVQMVRAGIGVGFVSRYGIPDGAGIRCKDGGLTRTLGVVRRRDRFLSHAAGAFERALLTKVE